MNNVSLVGRLCKEVESRQTTNGTSVCGFTLAVNRKFKRDGEPEADFLNVVAWKGTSDFCGKYFKKGQQIWLTGRLQTRTYDDKEGIKRYVTEIVAEEVGFADSKKEGNGEAPARQQAPPSQNQNQQQGQQSPPAQQQGQAAAGKMPWEQ